MSMNITNCEGISKIGWSTIFYENIQIILGKCKA